MQRNNRRQNGLIRVLSLLFIVFSVFSISVYQADCAGDESGGDSNDIWHIAGADSDSAPYDLTEFRDKVGEIYNLAIKISIPCGAVSFAFGAFRLLTGDEKAMEKGKNQMIFTVVAVAAIILLPLVVRAGIELGRTYGWTPPSIQPGAETT